MPEKVNQKMPSKYDYIVVGAGAAGCVLASRLSENPDIRVLLLEAGKDVSPGEERPNVKDAFSSATMEADLNWQPLIADVGPDRGGDKAYFRQYSQGFGVGGSSAINAMMAQRGVPDDYDGWAAQGAAGWSWDDVLPYFIKLENDQDFGAPLHGKSGPIPIRRAPREIWPPLPSATGKIWEAEGYVFEPDCNGFFGDCVTTIPLNNTPSERVSVASGYLTLEVRQRPNLQIQAETHVDRLLFEGNRVIGIQARNNGQVVEFRSSETILSGGAIQSPTLLLRSGVGDSEKLQALGIKPRINRPAVGENLNNHASFYLACHLPKKSKQIRSKCDYWVSCMLRYSSGLPGGADQDMQVVCTNRTAWHPLGWRIGALGLLLYKPHSIGRVTLKSADPDTQPHIQTRLLSDDRDFNRMVDGVGKAARWMSKLQKMGVINETFLPPGGRANKLNKPGLLNLIKTWLITQAFDLPFGLRRFLLRDLVLDLDRLQKDRQACAEIVRDHAMALHHVSGTCKMGAHDDNASVVDKDCRVIGAEGLRVADASIMPYVVRANTHLPIIMIAEKVASEIISSRTGKGFPPGRV